MQRPINEPDDGYTDQGVAPAADYSYSCLTRSKFRVRNALTRIHIIYSVDYESELTWRYCSKNIQKRQVIIQSEMHSYTDGHDGTNKCVFFFLIYLAGCGAHSAVADEELSYRDT